MKFAMFLAVLVFTSLLGFLKGQTFDLTGVHTS